MLVFFKKPPLAGLFLYICLIASNADAAPWLQKEGKGLSIQTNSFYEADEYFNIGSEKRAQQTYTKNEFSLYAEYGLLEWLTIGGNVSAQQLQQDGGTKSTFDVSDVELFARYKVFERDGAIFSLQPMLKIPTGYDENAALAAGSGQWDAEIRGQFGYAFQIADFNPYHFFAIDLGYRLRSGSPSNEVKLEGTIGIRPAEDWLIMGQLFQTQSTSFRGRSPFRNSNSEDYRLEKIQLSVVTPPVWGTAFQLGAFKDVRGRNTGAGKGAFIGIWKEF